MNKIVFLVFSVVLYSCQQSSSIEENTLITDTLHTEVMTADKQSNMSFNDVISELKEGNLRFVENHMYRRNNVAQLEYLESGQHPKAVVLSCIDSRVPVEEVFDQGVGDLFVIRVAGNIDNDHNLASLEYGCKVSGAKVIVVLGHEYCGAIKSAVKGVDMGNITELLSHVQPVLDKHEEFPGERTVDNPDFLELITKDNALMTLDDIRAHSAILNSMEQEDRIKLVAAYFDMGTGKILWLDEKDNPMH
ncbi:MAG: carbonic anhydrase [Bacteroidia bacterium]